MTSRQPDPSVSASSPRPTIHLVVNPVAGGHRPRRVAAIRRRFEGAGADVVTCESRPGATPLLGSADHVCVVGGDGTLRHVAASIMASGTATPISVFPGGTVNLVHRELGSARSVRGFVDHVLGGPALRRAYSATIDGRPFLVCASCGPDSVAVATVSLAAKRLIGRLAYALAFARALARWSPPRLTIACDGEPIAAGAFFVAKGRYYGGRWSLAPARRLECDHLTIVALPRAWRRDVLAFYARLALRLPIAAWRGAVVVDTRSARIASDRAMPVQADGDVVATLPATIAVAATPYHLA